MREGFVDQEPLSDANLPNSGLLSSRESQILGLAASGLLDKEIGPELGVSQNTLRTYWKRIRAKLGDGTRSALAGTYIRNEMHWVTSEEGVKLPLANTRSAIYYATALKRSQEAEQKASRALSVLRSFYNQAQLVFLEEMLLNLACRVLVDVGGYKIAWVGFPLEDEAKTVKPVASAGDGSGYLDATRVSWGDNIYGRGPTGRAMRLGKTALNRDFAVAPETAPWRWDASKAGLQSSISLPILERGKAVAALTTYAGEPDAFDTQEVMLLEEFASHLTNRLMAIRSVPLAGGQPASWELDLRTRRIRYFESYLSTSIGFEAGIEIPIDEVLEHYHPDDQEKVRSLLNLAELPEITNFALRARIVATAGLGLASAYVDVVRNPDGEAVYLRGRRIAIFDFAAEPDATFRIGQFQRNLRTGKVSIDDGIREIYGIKDEGENVGEQMLSRYHPDDAPHVRRIPDEMIRNNQTRKLRSFRISSEQGEYRWVTSIICLEHDAEGPAFANVTCIAYS